MALKIIVSYDDTDNDRDALALGRLLAFSGAELSLAYVRHSFGESLDQKEAEELLARGAESVGTPDMPSHVVVNPATSVGLTELAEREGADVIVFGSEYRTANGLVKPGISAHKLLLGGPLGDRRRSRRPALQPGALGQHRRRHRRGRRGRPGDRRQPRRGARRDRRRARLGPGRPARRRLASGGPAGQGRPQRRQRLRGRGGDLPGAGRSRAASRWTSPVPRPSHRRDSAPTASPAVDEDHGRDRGVAAVDPLPRLLQRHAFGLVAGDDVGDDLLRRVGVDEDAPGRARASAAVAACSTVAVTSSAERSAFDQPWLKARSWIAHLRALEDLQVALVAAASCGRRAGSAGPRARARATSAAGPRR